MKVHIRQSISPPKYLKSTVPLLSCILETQHQHPLSFANATTEVRRFSGNGWQLQSARLGRLRDLRQSLVLRASEMPERNGDYWGDQIVQLWSKKRSTRLAEGVNDWVVRPGSNCRDIGEISKHGYSLAYYVLCSITSDIEKPSQTTHWWVMCS